MKSRRLGFRKGFRVIPGNRRAQAAEMVIAPFPDFLTFLARERGMSARRPRASVVLKESFSPTDLI